METHCSTCDSMQPCEPAEEGSSTYMCLTCGDDVEISGSAGAGGKYDGYKVGKVLSVELIPKQKDLKKVLVDVVGDGDASNALTIVTNAKYVEESWLLVVATQGAVVPAGAVLDEDPEAIEVKKRAVGGVSSQGMLCDSPMLGWTGGAKGAIQRLPDTYEVGAAPPDARPR